MIYLAVFIGSLVFTGLVRMYAIRKSIVDIPNDRSSHSIPTPRGGGLAIAIVWFGGLIFYFVQNNMDSSLFYALLAGLPLSFIGFADDVFNLKPGVRFLIQFICAGLALWFLVGLQNIPIATINFQLWYLLTPLAFIAIIWAINLFNFLDGIDGYIGLEIVFIGFAIYVLTGDQLGMLLALSTLGFLIWNWPKAKIFMGDVGSTLLGFTVAVLAIYHQNKEVSSIWVWLILTAVFWFDATITLLRRIKNKEKLSEAHRKHAYQRIVQSGFSHQKTTLLALALNLIGFIFALLALTYSSFALLFLLGDLVLLFFVLNYIDKRKPFEYCVKAL